MASPLALSKSKKMHLARLSFLLIFLFWYFPFFLFLFLFGVSLLSSPLSLELRKTNAATEVSKRFGRAGAVSFEESEERLERLPKDIKKKEKERQKAKGRGIKI
mmetsp:Transcript_57972/g.116482  ORF Transcript_57972/g.116482 Transcript_57972/m.116482 type:complete len:104 (-) Transcript_57972:1955-2266(-)